MRLDGLIAILIGDRSVDGQVSRIQSLLLPQSSGLELTCWRLFRRNIWMCWNIFVTIFINLIHLEPSLLLGAAHHGNRLHLLLLGNAFRLLDLLVLLKWILGFLVRSRNLLLNC